MPTITRVTKEFSRDRTHQHIAGVCTADNGRYTRQQVVDGVGRGEVWETSDGRTRARVKVIRFCPASGCLVTPYITTAPDHSITNNLDNLPAC